MSDAPADRLTADDRAFLARPLHGFPSVAAGPLPPQPRPVWSRPPPTGLADDWVRVVIHPDDVRRFAF